MRAAARPMMLVGTALLALALLARLGKLSSADLIADDLSVFTSLVVAMLGVACLRFGKE